VSFLSPRNCQQRPLHSLPSPIHLMSDKPPDVFFLITSFFLFVGAWLCHPEEILCFGPGVSPVFLSIFVRPIGSLFTHEGLRNQGVGVLPVG